jgi:hypothetical protein
MLPGASDLDQGAGEGMVQKTPILLLLTYGVDTLDTTPKRVCLVGNCHWLCVSSRGPVPVFLRTIQSYADTRARLRCEEPEPHTLRKLTWRRSHIGQLCT